MGFDPAVSWGEGSARPIGRQVGFVPVCPAPPPDIRTSLVSEGEKFADPRFACLGGIAYRVPESAFEVSESLGPRFEKYGGADRHKTGLEYLADVPPNAVDRVRAIRQKINNKRGGSPNIVAGPTIQALYEAGWNNLVNMKKDLFGKLKSGEQAATIAALAVGSVPAVKELTAQLASPSTSSYDLGVALDKAWNSIKPQVYSIMSDLSGPVSNFLGSLDLGGAGSGMFADVSDAIANGAKGLGPMIPVFGAAFKASMAILDSYQADRAKEMAALCATFTEHEINDPMAQLRKLGLPFPLHIFEKYSLKCNDPSGDYSIKKVDITSDQYRIGLALKNQATWLLCLPVPYQFAITQWWTLAVSLMGDDKIAEVFAALGDDAIDGFFASDEQVMLVAAPIAVANGLNVDDFARALWERSKGWSAAPESLQVRPLYVPRNIPCKGFDAFDPSTWEARACGLTMIGPFCTTEAANAAIVQLGVLCVDAFQLLDEVKAATRPVGTFKPSAAFNQRVAETAVYGSKSVTPLVVGGGASVLAYMLGLSFPLSALPAAIGIVAYLFEPRPETTRRGIPRYQGPISAVENPAMMDIAAAVDPELLARRRRATTTGFWPFDSILGVEEKRRVTRVRGQNP